MLEETLASEEQHQHWLESQLELIRRVGEANYLTQQITKPPAEQGCELSAPIQSGANTG